MDGSDTTTPASNAEADATAIGPSDGAGYRVLARKYRPSSFADLVGQEPMVQTLTNAFRTGRIAQAYMLTGVRGVGKTTTARILARALNYEIPGEVDQPTIEMDRLGEHCAAIMEGRHVDVIEMDAASHTGIDDIREIIEAVRYKPAVARYKVYIIDEVHMLSKAAFNGLLKTLEEPPPHVKFVFATTEIRKVPITVLSRCQRFDLRRIESGRLVSLMRAIAEKESVGIESEALAMIARAAEGSARDALSLLDQSIAHASGEVQGDQVAAMLGLADRTQVIDLFEDVFAGNTAVALERLSELHDVGADPAVVLEDLAVFAHTVTRLKISPAAAEDETLTEEERRRGLAFADKLSLRVLTRAWQMLLKGIEETRAATRPLAAADMVVVRLAHVADLPTPDEALRTMGNAPRQTGGAAAPSTAGASAPTGVSAAAQPQSAPGPASSSPPKPPPPQARLAGDLGASAAMPEPALPEPALPASSEPPPRLETFDDLVAHAGASRDLKLKHQLEHMVRPGRFEPGRIELGLTDDAPPGFAGELGRALEAWTGRRWMIAVNREVTTPTVEETRRSQKDRLFDGARADPAVAAALDLFPGSYVANVIVRPDETPSVSAEDQPDDGDD